MPNIWNRIFTKLFKSASHLFLNDGIFVKKYSIALNCIFKNSRLEYFVWHTEKSFYANRQIVFKWNIISKKRLLTTHVASWSLPNFGLMKGLQKYSLISIYAYIYDEVFKYELNEEFKVSIPCLSPKKNLNCQWYLVIILTQLRLFTMSHHHLKMCLSSCNKSKKKTGKFTIPFKFKNIPGDSDELLLQKL